MEGRREQLRCRRLCRALCRRRRSAAGSVLWRRCRALWGCVAAICFFTLLVVGGGSPASANAPGKPLAFSRQHPARPSVPSPVTRERGRALQADNLAALAAADAGGLLLRLLDPASAPAAGRAPGRAPGAVTVSVHDWDTAAWSGCKDSDPPALEAADAPAGRRTTLAELAAELRRGGWLRAVITGTVAALDPAAAAAAAVDAPARVVELLGHCRRTVRRRAAEAAATALQGGCYGGRTAVGLARAALAALAAAGGEVRRTEQVEILLGLIAAGRRATKPGAPATAAAPWAGWLVDVAAAASAGLARLALCAAGGSDGGDDAASAGLTAGVALAAAEAHPAALTAACRAGLVEAASAVAVAGPSPPSRHARTAATARLEAVRALLCVVLSAPQPPPPGPQDPTGCISICSDPTAAAATAGHAGAASSGGLQEVEECTATAAAAAAAAEAALTGPVLRHAADAGGSEWSVCAAVLQVPLIMLSPCPPPASLARSRSTHWPLSV